MHRWNACWGVFSKQTGAKLFWGVSRPCLLFLSSSIFILSSMLQRKSFCCFFLFLCPFAVELLCCCVIFIYFDGAEIKDTTATN